jgi:hypothetical protein
MKLHLKILILLTFIFSSSNLLACKCKTYNFKEQIKMADYIIVGKVVEIIKAQGYYCSSSNMGSMVKLKISKVYKSDLDTTEVIIDSGLLLCSICFELQKEYLIYGYFKGDHLITDICSRSELLEKSKEDIEKLNNTKFPGKKQ